MSQPSQALDTLRLTDREWKALLDQLETGTPMPARGNARRDQRQTYRNMPQVLLAVEHPAHSWARFRVRPRNISAGGLGFFHGSYIHQNARVVTVLPGRDHGLKTIEGRVRRCEFLGGKIHQVGVQFSQPVDVADLLQFGVADTIVPAAAG